MAKELVKKLGFKRRSKRFYYISKKSDLMEMDIKSKKITKVKSLGINKKKGYFYFLDKKGDISRSRMKNSKGEQ